MSMSLDLTEGTDYRYAELMAALDGGSNQFYLPFRGQQVFAAFLNRSKNPKAPDVILVGTKPRVAQAGARLAAQQTPVPVFVKLSTDRWKYHGQYRSSSILDRKTTEVMASEAKRVDVAFGLRLEKIAGEAGTYLPLFEEGRCGQVTRNVYERSDEAREMCLQHYGRRCYVCDLLFAEEYGERGDGFIHVHHLRPIHMHKGRTIETDPIGDLRPVCPNCHAMLHASGKLLTPEEVRKVYWSQASKEHRIRRLTKQ